MLNRRLMMGATLMMAVKGAKECEPCPNGVIDCDQTVKELFCKASRQTDSEGQAIDKCVEDGSWDPDQVDDECPWSADPTTSPSNSPSTEPSNSPSAEPSAEPSDSPSGPTTKSPSNGASMINPIFMAIFMMAVYIGMN